MLQNQSAKRLLPEICRLDFRAANSYMSATNNDRVRLDAVEQGWGWRRR
jgi:hypothetical protein